MNSLALMIRSRKITQRRVARALGISEAAVSLQIKKGIRSISTARRYAAVLECNPFLLLD